MTSGPRQQELVAGELREFEAVQEAVERHLLLLITTQEDVVLQDRLVYMQLPHLAYQGRLGEGHSIEAPQEEQEAHQIIPTEAHQAGYITVLAAHVSAFVLLLHFLEEVAAQPIPHHQLMRLWSLMMI